MRNTDKVNTLRLSKLISKDSGYFRYQVDDIIESLTRVLFQELIAGREVTIGYVGTFHIKTKAANKIFYHNTKSYREYPERKRVLFKVASTLRKAIEPSYAKNQGRPLEIVTDIIRNDDAGSN